MNSVCIEDGRHGAPEGSKALAWLRDPRRLFFIVVSASALLGVAVFGVLELRQMKPLLPLCPFHELTGLHCAGCGSTRALHCLLHGRLADAMRLNLLFVLAVPFAAYLWLCWGGWALLRKRLPLPRPSLPLILSVAALLFLFGALRNIPFRPFSLLAPRQEPASISIESHETEGGLPP